MRFPIQADPVVRFATSNPFSGDVSPSDCPWYKKAACLAAAASCGVACVGTIGAACLECVGAVIGGCGDCL